MKVEGRQMSLRDDRFLKRLRRKARRGMRGWPVATIAFYRPNLGQATKVAVGIVPSEGAEVETMRDWHVASGDIREDIGIAQEILEFIASHGALNVAMPDGILGCPHRQGLDYEGLIVGSRVRRKPRLHGGRWLKDTVWFHAPMLYQWPEVLTRWLVDGRWYYPDRKRVPRKLRSLIDFLRAEKAGRVATEAVLA
jgi:hypothetical protein